VVQHRAVLDQDVEGLLVRVQDQLADLFVDRGRDLLGVVPLAAEVAAEERLAAVLAELDRTQARSCRTA